MACFFHRASTRSRKCHFAHANFGPFRPPKTLPWRLDYRTSSFSSLRRHTGGFPWPSSSHHQDVEGYVLVHVARKSHLKFLRQYTYCERVVNASPACLTPYLKLMRLDRPAGTWVIYLPGLWSICLAAEAGVLPDLNLMVLFGVGALLMRGAGCTINDIFDKDLDRKVERTRGRPLPSEALTIRQAVSCLAAQLSAALFVLLQLNTYCIVLGAASMIPVTAYPFFKRFTYYPQIFLGVTLNWGALLGWAAVKGSCDWSVCLPLYLSGIFWSIYYDTVYSYQDRKDDVLAGVKSMALKLGDYPKPSLRTFTTLMASGLLTAGFNCEQTLPFYAAVVGTYGWLLIQISRLNIHDGTSCGEVFSQQKFVGLVIAMGIIVGTLAKEDAVSGKKLDTEAGSI